MTTKNTIQKQVVLNAVLSLKTHPSAEEVYSFISKDFPTISLATVYRNLNALSGEGKIQKIVIANSPDRFDHKLGKHSHCRCSSCGRVYDFPFVPEISPKSFEVDFFRAMDYYLVIDGVCAQCESQNIN